MPPPVAAQQHQQHAQLAGFGQRLGGYVLDYILYGLLAILLMIPGLAMAGTAVQGCEVLEYTDGTAEFVCDDGSPAWGLLLGGGGLVILGLLVVAVLYIRALGRTGQTWGRKIAGVRVVRQDNGQPIGVGKAFGRALFAGFISGQIFALGYLWMIWDDRNQTWHDKVVGSVVVKA
jgi:uncharacterized RDD family membrane protein YckC